MIFQFGLFITSAMNNGIELTHSVRRGICIPPELKYEIQLIIQEPFLILIFGKAETKDIRL